MTTRRCGAVGGARDASADLVLFLEYVPRNLVEWLTGTGDDHSPWSSGICWR